MVTLVHMQYLINDQENVPLKLQKLLEVVLSFRPGTLSYILSFRVNLLQLLHENVCKDLMQCIKIAQCYSSDIKQARVSEKTCKNQAVWIGLERSGSTFCDYGFCLTQVIGYQKMS